MISFAVFRTRMLSALGELVQSYAKPNMTSRTLAKSLTFTVEPRGTGYRVRMHLPFYWARYVHDGRGPINMPPGRFMVFFPNSKDDPRTDGGTNYPRTESDRRRLTKEQFKHFMRINRRNAKRGLPPIMVVTRHVDAVAGDFAIRDAVTEVASNGTLGELVDLSLRSFLQQKLPLSGKDRAVLNLG